MKKIIDKLVEISNYPELTTDLINKLKAKFYINFAIFFVITASITAFIFKMLYLFGRL